MIDDHVHPFPFEFEPFDLGTLGLDVGVHAGRCGPVTAAGLGPALRAPPGDPVGDAARLATAEVAAHRDELARRDWPAYLRMLFDDAGLTGMVVDEALHPDQPSRPASDYQNAAGRPVWKMARLDPLIDQLVGDGASAEEILERVQRYMAEAAAGGALAFKTVLAYRTGLAVRQDADLTGAQRSLAEDVPVRRRGKALRDLVFRSALGTAAELGLPVQVHAGFGDSEIRLAESDPLLLTEVLRTPEGAAATVVLIHGSFPGHEQAAYLASVRPNLWVELSLSNLFAPLYTADQLLRILDLAPRGRVLLGTDGHELPETQWFACRVVIDAWTQVARWLTDAGARGRPGSWRRETLYSKPTPASCTRCPDRVAGGRPSRHQCSRRQLCDQLHFSSEGQGTPTARGRYADVRDVSPVEFVPGLEFRPVVGEKTMTNFVRFEPHTEAPRHSHEEEQIVIVFEFDGDVRTMRPGDVAVVPSWVSHGADTLDSPCYVVDVFNPPRRTLLDHAAARTGQLAASDGAGQDDTTTPA